MFKSTIMKFAGFALIGIGFAGGGVGWRAGRFRRRRKSILLPGQTLGGVGCRCDDDPAQPS